MTATAGSAAPKRLVVVVPAYNEHLTIADTIVGIRSVSARLGEMGVDLSIYVVDDGSVDKTGDLARQAGADRVLVHKVNQGLGAAVRTGLREARDAGFDIAVKFDADRQHDPHQIADLIKPILDDEADLVYGDRQVAYKMPLIRRAGNIVFSRLMRWLTGWPLNDSQPGVFAASRDYLKVFSIGGDYNYTQQVLLDAYHKGMRFTHVPVIFNKRHTGSSFVSLKYPTKVIPYIIYTIAAVKPMKVFFPIGATFFIFGLALFTWQFAEWLFGYSDRPVQQVNLVLGSILFGLQTIFFGVLAQLIVQTRKM